MMEIVIISRTSLFSFLIYIPAPFPHRLLVLFFLLVNSMTSARAYLSSHNGLHA
jgi:hypothetical protein